MGIWNVVKKLFASKKPQEEEQESNHDEEKEITQLGDEGILEYHCEQIVDAAYQLEDLKMEYEVVTSYFTDIQKIEQLAPQQREEVDSIARKIQMLEQDRVSFQTSERKLPSHVYSAMSRYQDVLPKEMERLQKYEEQKSLLKRDMEHLEGEKGALHYQEERLEERKSSLKGILISFLIMLPMILGLFYIIASQYNIDMQIPIFLVLCVGMVAVLIAFLNFRQLEYDLKLCYAKRNRAVNLSNKVKVKYVNTTNALDYAYEKYHVNGIKELMYVWEQYLYILEEEKRYHKNTDDLDFYNKELIRILRNIGVRDVDVWQKQPQALLDNREMVEIKHSLNVRRQKLREQLAYNEKVRKNGFAQIKSILKSRPDLASNVKEILSAYHINTE